MTASARRFVLVVDDEELVGRAISRVLERAHDVCVVVSGRAALEHIAARAPDVILCDLMMPEMTGIELHAKVAQAHPALAERMVFITGAALTVAAREFVDRMQGRVLLKPARVDEILQAIERFAPRDQPG